MQKPPDSDLLREMIGFAAERLMELEVGAATGAAYGEKNPLRTAQRNRYRERDRETRAAATPCKQKAPRKAPLNRLIPRGKLERVKRFERSTPTLATP